MRRGELKKLRSANTVFFHDLVMAVLAWLGSYWLRFNLGEIPPEALDAALMYLPLVVVVQAMTSRYFGLYRGVWRFASVPDLIRIAKSVLTGVLIIGLVLFLYNRLEHVPRSVLPLYAFLFGILLSGPRFFYRYWKDEQFIAIEGKRTLIVGAGDAGEQLARDLLRRPDAGYIPIVFVDDDANKKNRDIRGIRVAGSIGSIKKLVKKHKIQTILIAIPSANSAEMQRIVVACEQSERAFLTLPSVEQIISGNVTKESLREVSINDLLGRKPVKLDWRRIQKNLNDKVVLVTGGGGSIGSELCKQLAGLSLKQLIIFERSEFNLYKIEAELIEAFPKLQLTVVLGDIVDRTAIAHVFKEHTPQIVFHAAAYKHVPLLESQHREAVRNNLVGVRNVALEAIDAEASEFVMISTDKVVNPTNIMGATKKAAEILCQALNKTTDTNFVTVRFGNVLGSAGSVVPLFQEQIKKGGPVTVTDPDITRYFMTIPEACQLIMEASAIGEGGEIFVLDMGDPIKISYLAKQMIFLSARASSQEIKIEYTGLRAGEKLHEELFHADEKLTFSGFEKLFFAVPRDYDNEWVFQKVEETIEASNSFEGQNIKRLLKELVPDYSYE